MADSDLDYAKVTGRFGITVGDDNDVDELPEIIYCTSGSIELYPLQSPVKVVGANPVPLTLGNAVIVADINAEGYLEYRGVPRVWVPDLTSEKVNPRIVDDAATHEVRFVNVMAEDIPVIFPSGPVRITAAGPNGDGVNDLTTLLPVLPGAAEPIFQGPRGTSIETASVEGGELIIGLEDGTELNAGELPVGPGGSDAGVADYITTPGTATADALSATFVPAVVAVGTGIDPTGAADSTSALEAKIAEAAAAPGGATGLYIPPGEYLVTSGLSVDVTKVVLSAEGAVLRPDAGVAVALTVTGTEPSPYTQARSLGGLRVEGPGGSPGARTGVGVLFAATTLPGPEGPSHITVQQLSVHGFATGIEFGDNAYCINFVGVDVWSNDVDVDFPAGLNNAGERITWVGCTFFNSVLGIRNHGAEMAFVSCSFDYNAQQFDIDGGQVFIDGGSHIEGNTATYGTNYPVEITGDSALFVMSSGQITGSCSTSPAFFHNTTPTSGGAGVYLTDKVVMNGQQPASGYLADGGGITEVDTITSVTNTNARRVSAAGNLLIDGDFEAATILDDIFITDDIGGVTERHAGANLQITLSADNPRTGAKSLKVHKISGGGGAAAFAVAVPLARHGVKQALNFWYAKPGANVNNVAMTTFYGVVREVAGLPKIIRQGPAIGFRNPLFSAAAVPYTEVLTDNAAPPPAWATHVYLLVELFAFDGPGDFYLDSIEATSGL